MIRNSVFLLCLLYSCVIHAQEFRYKADIEQNAATAFYNIQLGADVRAKAQLDLRDVRISDGRGKFTPFVVVPQSEMSVASDFHEFPIVSKTQDTSGNTLIVIETTKGSNTDHISLVIGNNEVSRSVDVSGSHDAEEWYAIQEDLPLVPAPDADKDRFVQTVQFPPVSYKYFRLTIHNRKRQPLDIQKAGVYDHRSLIHRGNIINPPVVVDQKDSSDGYSYIYITQEDAFPLDGIRIAFRGAKFFERDAQVYVLRDSTLQTGIQLANFTVSSTSLDRHDDTVFNPVYFSQTTKAVVLLLKVYNGDNPPLQVPAVETYHTPALLCAWLEKGKQYHLLFGNDSVSSPVYDLNKFRDSIPTDVTKLMHSAVTVAAAGDQMKEEAGNKRLLWFIIIGVVILLGFFSWKLVGEMNNKNEQ